MTGYCPMRGLEVSMYGDRLTIQVPIELAPERRYCAIRTMTDDEHCYVELHEQEPFDIPIPGRYAWQKTGFSPSYPGSTRMIANRGTTRIQVPLTRLPGLKNIRPLFGAGTEAEAYRIDRTVFLRFRIKRFDKITTTPRRRLLDEINYSMTCPIDTGSIREAMRRSMANHIHVTTTTTTKRERKEYPIMNIPAGTRIVNVRFQPEAYGYGSQKTYAYYSNDESIKEGDLVVVSSPNSNGNSFERGGGYPVIVEVVSTEETIEGIEKAAKFIVCKVDMTEHDARIEQAKRRALIVAKIKRAEKQAREKLELAKLKELSPELGDLLKELESLDA